MSSPLGRLALVGLLLLQVVLAFAADTASITLASTRTAFTVLEPVELAVLYANDGGSAKTLPVQVTHRDGSMLTFQVPVNVAPGKSGSRLLTIKGGTLKPGEYLASVRVGGSESTTTFSVFPSEHANAYYVGEWVFHGATAGTALAKGGWMYMNGDYVSLHPRTPKAGDLAESYVAARMRPYALMVFGGGHQLDLEMANDWGDPWVQRSIMWRMQLAALSDRIYPMAGLHCYDEPGLTWWPVKDKDGKDLGASPFAIPHQLEEFAKRTGKTIPNDSFENASPQYAKHLDDWLAFAELRMTYLEQAWNATVWGTNSVHPAFNTINQVSSSYAPGDTTDGVDSRQNRAYDIFSGHGGYSDLPYGTMQPIRSAESFRGYSWDKQHLYLPMWYVHNWASIRNAVWMSYATKLEGMMYTPSMDFELNGDVDAGGYLGTHTIFEVAETNRRMALVGDAMRQVKMTVSPVAVIHSSRQVAYDIAMNTAEGAPKQDGMLQYASEHRDAVDACFFRVLETGMIPNWIDEVEAAEKGGAFLKQWKVIFCPRLATATPAFRKALEEYVVAGGKLIQLKGDKLIIPGAIVADHGVGNSTKYWMENVNNQNDSNAGTDLSWRKWNMASAPTFAQDLAGWLGEQPYSQRNKDVLLAVHKAGAADYLLMANNAQDPVNPRGIKHELIAADTAVKVPAGGVIYDLFNGGVVPVANGQAQLHLAAGDGACWLRLPAAPGKPQLAAKVAGENLQITVTWGTAGYLPFRLRIYDPAGNKVDDLYRATIPQGNATRFTTNYPLGANAAPGVWIITVNEWLTGSAISANVRVKPAATGKLGLLNTESVSIYFDDAQKIARLFAGKAAQPDFSKMNWDARRVLGTDPKKFAVFGPDAVAKLIADALTAKGMTVAINPPYAVENFKREPNRGGAGPTFREANFENIYAHTIVISDQKAHPLAQQSINRGHINRPVTNTFPGPGRAFIQWGISCYQAGWENVFVFGDSNAGVAWLLDAINGKPVTNQAELTATVKTMPVSKPAFTAGFAVAQQIKTNDTPVGIASSNDGKTTFALLYDGTVSAYDAAGKTLWKSAALEEGHALALNPQGDRLAVAGYPGMLMLDAKSGKVLDGFRTTPIRGTIGTGYSNAMIDVTWNSAGTLAAGCWANTFKDAKEGTHKALELVVLDAQGKRMPAVAGVYDNVMGITFMPNSNTLLVGADQLIAVNAADGAELWRNGIKGAQCFTFSANGAQCVAGGWGKSVGTFAVADGKVTNTVSFDSIVGGIATLPDGALVVAAWGGVHPLYIVRNGETKPAPFFQSRFGFQHVLWSEANKGLIAAEEGGNLWLLNADGTPKALLDDEAGTTAYRCKLLGKDILLSRMNRAVQRITVK